jgi:hypothetical protein
VDWITDEVAIGDWRDAQDVGTADSERLRYKMSMQMPDGQTRPLAITRFLFVKGADAYTVTLTTSSDREAQYAATFEKIGQSFRFIR